MAGRFQVRDFVWDDQVAEKQRQELEEANVSEKELWTELLRLARTNFSEAYMVLSHLKVIRSFVESVLRYGLPAEYFGVAVKVCYVISLLSFKAIIAKILFTFDSPIQRGQKHFYRRYSLIIHILQDQPLTRRKVVTSQVVVGREKHQANMQHYSNKKNGLLY